MLQKQGWWRRWVAGPVVCGLVWGLQACGGGGGGSNDGGGATPTQAPQITTAPASVTVVAGTSANFQVVASGSAPLAYQWLRNGVALTGATASSYTTGPAVDGDNGALFSVRVSNAAGSATSSTAMLTVTTPATAPTIVSQPADTSAVQGSVASFSVQASSAGSTAAYQWRRNGVDIAGATAASYTTSALGPADDGARFSVLVSNTAGSVLSSEALLRVTPLAGAPTISAQPQDAAVLAGASAQFSVTATATGGGTLGYQWYRNGSAIAGATAASYTTPVLAWTDHGALYSVVVGLAGANVSSRTATLTVNPRVQQVSAGTAMVMALMENGQVLGIGRSAALAIGTPTSNSSTVPQWARTADGAVLTGITGLRTGWEYTVAWTSAGTLWTWGSGNSSLPGSGYGATVMKRADGSALPAMRNADGGINSANAVALDGAVWQWGLTPSGSLPAPSVANAADRVALSDIRQSSAYGDHAAALKGDGTVWLWGTAQFGVLGNGTTSGSRSYAAALTDAAGNLVTGAREVRVGAGHSVVLLQDGTVLAFGRNFWGELGDGTQTQRTWPVAVRTSDGRVLDQVTAIQAASDATAYLRSDGTVWMTGRNVEGLMARPSSTTQVSSPTRVLMANGQPLDNVVQMSMHGNVVVVLRGDGSVWGWGATSQGQLGTTTTLSAGCICSTTPVRLPLSP